MFDWTQEFKAFSKGLDEAQLFLKMRIREIEEYWKEEPHTSSTSLQSQKSRVEKSQGKKAFVVHDHNNEIKQAVARVLEKLGLEPVILHEKPNTGKTLIEKFEAHSSDVSYAVVILTSDDMAFSREESPDKARPRPRQNVVFELGFFIGRLDRKNVFILYQKEVGFELLSDYEGVTYTSYDSAGQWRFELVRELKAQGYEVDANKIIL